MGPSFRRDDGDFLAPSTHAARKARSLAPRQCGERLRRYRRHDAAVHVPGGVAEHRQRHQKAEEVGRSRRLHSCYLETMAKQKKAIAKGAKTSRFVIGRAGFGKISAVEGIQITPAMKKRAGDAIAKKLTAEEYRRMIIRSYRKG
jgi:hypothetical protein